MRLIWDILLYLFSVFTTEKRTVEIVCVYSRADADYVLNLAQIGTKRQSLKSEVRDFKLNS